MDKKTSRKLESYRIRIRKFNSDLLEYYSVTGETELLEVDTSIIGETDAVQPYEITDTPDGFTVDMGWQKVRVEVDGEGYITGWDDIMDNVKDCIAYDRRKLAKSWRVWRSDNPDAELEKEDED